MKKMKSARQYRALAVVWTFAALSMALGVSRQMPDPNPSALVILVLSVAAAGLWWSAYLKAAKAETTKQPNKPIKDSEEKKHER